LARQGHSRSEARYRWERAHLFDVSRFSATYTIGQNLMIWVLIKGHGI